MKIAVIGIGGVGGFFGGLMAKAGLDVTFVARGEHFEQIRTQGLDLSTTEGDFHIQIPHVVDHISKLTSPDVVFICTKTYDRNHVAEQLNSVVHADTIIIPLENGIDNDLIIREHCKTGKIYAGVVYLISAKIEPGKIHQMPGPKKIFFGERNVIANHKLIEVENMLRQAGIEASASDDIIREIWLKFVWLTTFAGMTSLCRSPIGPIIADQDSKQLLFNCLDEAIAVAASQGIVLADEEREGLRLKSEEYLIKGPQSKSSMLVDIENLRLTEVESLNGIIVALGRKYGVAVPIHETIYSAVKIASENYAVVK
jgi:2-dehydropantoate 2-reductase